MLPTRGPTATCRAMDVAGLPSIMVPAPDIPFGGPRVDEAIEREILRVLSPGAVEAAMATAVTIDEEGAACGALDQAPGRAAHHPGREVPPPRERARLPALARSSCASASNAATELRDEEAPRPCAPGDRGDHREGWGSRRGPVELLRSLEGGRHRRGQHLDAIPPLQPPALSPRIPALDPAVDRLHLVTVATAAKVLGVSAPPAVGPHDRPGLSGGDAAGRARAMGDS